RGAWHFTPITPLSLGEHRVTAHAELSPGGQVGLTSPPSEARSFTLVEGPPLPPAILSPVGGSPAPQTGLTFTGTAEPGASVILTVDGMEAWSAMVDPAGAWTALVPWTLRPGAHRAWAQTVIGPVRSAPSETVSFTTTGKSRYTFGCSAAPSGNLAPWAVLLVALGWLRVSRGKPRYRREWR
ncbi:MAG TPA: hypothetical protein VND93_29720, partial [Myxococcales bacterium]|nr:hypothetical protein [Myxococcales bacterium]